MTVLIGTTFTTTGVVEVVKEEGKADLYLVGRENNCPIQLCVFHPVYEEVGRKIHIDAWGRPWVLQN